MAKYWSEFLLVALVHLVAVASPGPDFAMVLRQSVIFGRRPAIWTSLGIGTGIFLHVAYSLLGIGLLVRSSVLAFNVLKWLGAIYQSTLPLAPPDRTWFDSTAMYHSRPLPNLSIRCSPFE